MALLDLLGRRWSLRILWELRDGPLASRSLRAAAGGVSPTVLQARMDELRQASLVALDPQGYVLTHLGKELIAIILPLYRFAESWARQLPGADPQDRL